MSEQPIEVVPVPETGEVAVIDGEARQKAVQVQAPTEGQSAVVQEISIGKVQPGQYIALVPAALRVLAGRALSTRQIVEIAEAEGLIMPQSMRKGSTPASATLGSHFSKLAHKGEIARLGNGLWALTEDLSNHPEWKTIAPTPRATGNGQSRVPKATRVQSVVFIPEGILCEHCNQPMSEAYRQGLIETYKASQRVTEAAAIQSEWKEQGVQVEAAVQEQAKAVEQPPAVEVVPEPQVQELDAVEIERRILAGELSTESTEFKALDKKTRKNIKAALKEQTRQKAFMEAAQATNEQAATQEAGVSS